MTYFQKNRSLTLQHLADVTGLSWDQVKWRVKTGELPPPTEPLPSGKKRKQYRADVFELCRRYLEKAIERNELLRCAGEVRFRTKRQRNPSWLWTYPKKQEPTAGSN